MEIVTEYSQVETQWDSDSDDPENSWSWQEGNIYRLLSCIACNKVLLQADYIDTRYEDEDAHRSYQTLYPQIDTMPKVLPPNVSREYEAAVKVKTINANAYAVLLGRVFDKVCEDRKASGRTLSERLSDLAKRGEIPNTLADMAQSLRQLRNVGAHADLGDLTTEEIQLLDAILRAVLEYLYRAPQILKQAQIILAKRKTSAS